MIGWLTNKDLAQTQKEVVAAYCKVLLQDFLGITEENCTKSQVKMAELGAESLTQNLWNTGDTWWHI